MKEIKLTTEEIQEIKSNIPKHPTNYMNEFYYTAELDMSAILYQAQAYGATNLDELCNLTIIHEGDEDGFNWEVSGQIPITKERAFDQESSKALKAKQERYKKFLKGQKEFEGMNNESIVIETIHK